MLVAGAAALLADLAFSWWAVSWYLVGVARAIWVARDIYAINTPVPAALKWAWPIIVLFFSVLQKAEGY